MQLQVLIESTLKPNQLMKDTQTMSMMARSIVLQLRQKRFFKYAFCWFFLVCERDKSPLCEEGMV